MPGSRGFVSPIVTVKSSLGELLAHKAGCGSLEDRHLQLEGLSPSAVGQTLILTFGGTTKMLNLLEEAGLVTFRPSNPSNMALERDSIVRIKIAGFVDRLTVPSKKD
jgi:hypothetical protein